jgi:hypothetical protein
MTYNYNTIRFVLRFTPPPFPEGVKETLFTECFDCVALRVSGVASLPLCKFALLSAISPKSTRIQYKKKQLIQLTDRFVT